MNPTQSHKMHNCHNIMSLIVLLISVFFLTKTAAASAVTYDLGGTGRLGDKLVLYWKAKVFAHAYNLPLLYKALPRGGEQFLLNQEEKKYFNEKNIQEFQQIKIVNDKYVFKKSIDRSVNTLYVVRLNMPTKNLLSRSSFNHTTFNEHFKHMLTPLIEIHDIFRPKNQISVAVHVRTGGGYDKIERLDVANNINKRFPLKFPPLDYYTKQIKKIWKMLGKQHLYIHVFTDDKNPEKLINFFKENLQEMSLTFSARLEGNSYYANVLDDLFAMAKFDCLIRPASNLSKISELLGNHLITISPIDSYWKNKKLIINKVSIIDRRKNNFQKNNIAQQN